MREAGIFGGFQHGSQAKVMRSMQRSALLVAAGLVSASLIASTAARANDDEEQTGVFDSLMSLDQRIMKNIMEGLGSTNMDHGGINYRERSPLVIPPKLDLPQPESNAQAPAANWPKDVDAQRRRREAVEANRNDPMNFNQDARTLTPSEMAPKRGKRSNSNVAEINPNPMLQPGQLGYSGGLLNVFKGTNKSEVTTFVSEPERSTLTQPPAGYQTPSSNFEYGTGPREIKPNTPNIMTGKY